MNPEQRKELVRIVAQGVCRGMFMYILCTLAITLALCVVWGVVAVIAFGLH
jgi:hypothetical protein